VPDGFHQPEPEVGARVADPRAELASFVASRGPALLRLARLLTADPDTAQDLVQEALARVLPRWDRIAGGGDPERYVRTVIRSAWIDRWRRSGVRPDVVPELTASPSG
jgi:DNA-directed RNA polymerase specialized sigma24 family protein